MNIIELAKKAGFNIKNFDPPVITAQHSSGWVSVGDELETFAHLVIEDFVKGVDMEPIGFMWQHDETGRVGFADEMQRSKWKQGNPRLNIVAGIFTATQMAAQRQRALEEVAKVCESMERSYWRSAEDQNNFTPIDCAQAIRALGGKNV